MGLLRYLSRLQRRWAGDPHERETVQRDTVERETLPADLGEREAIPADAGDQGSLPARYAHDCKFLE